MERKQGSKVTQQAQSAKDMFSRLIDFATVLL